MNCSHRPHCYTGKTNESPMIVPALAYTLATAHGRFESSQNKVHRCRCVGFSHSLHTSNESAPIGSQTETQHQIMCLAVETKCI